MPWSKPPLPANEARRVEALRKHRLLDTAPEREFDDFARLAALVCDTPIALVNLVDAERQFSKARIGLDIVQTPREQAFCSYTILSDGQLEVPDATKDERFAGNPLVTSEPHIRFYLGSPLLDHEGFALGSLCVIDRKPRALSAAQREGLEALARQFSARLELRRQARELAELLAEVKALQGLLPICAHCKGIRDDAGYWQSVEEYLRAHGDLDFTHSICPACFEKHYPEIYARVKSRLE
ncbi:MAG: GAF domain-containing protein [Verrucomicrobia bacterium]|nr:GAF domain-containing protein [Verrucomicrobiota bacterium]